jgi:hypothetical protein
VSASRTWAHDVAIGALVLTAATWWGTHYARASGEAGRQPGVVAEVAEPAVLTACGYGLHFTESQPRALTRFLAHEDDRFSCDVLRSAPLSSRPLVQGAWLYLLLMTAGAWKLFGVSWSGLVPLCGFLFGLTSTAAYAIFRFGMGRVLAAAATFAFSVSTLNLLELLNIRDYARAPFMLALVAMALGIGLRRLTPRRLVALCGAYGALAGIGYGIRTDVIVQLPLLIMTVLFFVPGTSARDVRLKGAALVVAAATFLLAALPLFRHSAETGSNVWHFALIGFMPEYGDALGVENATYHWGVTGSDEAIQLAVADSTLRMHPDWPRPTLATREYEVATRSYYLEIARRFPADMLTRAMASIVRMPEVAFGWPMPPVRGHLEAFYAAREWTLGPLYGYGILFTGAALIGAALTRPRDGLFFAAVLAYVGSYPAIQFMHRHFFYLETITWMSVGFLASQLIRMIRTRQVFASDVPARTLVRHAIGIVAVTLTLLIVLAGVRAYQARHVRQTIAGYLRAPAHVLALDRSDRNGTHVAAVPALAAQSARLDWARMIRVDLNAAACSGATVTFRYDRTSPYRGLSLSSVLPSSSGAGTDRLVLFEPLYTGFESVEFQGARGECLRSISQVTGLDGEPVWLPLVLAPDWRSTPLYQTVRTRENIH